MDITDASPGLWLITRTRNSRGASKVTHLTEIPEDVPVFTKLMSYKDELATYMRECDDKFSKTHPSTKEGWVMMPSYAERAQAVLDFFAEKQLCAPKKKRKSTVERNIVLTL